MENEALSKESPSTGRRQWADRFAPGSLEELLYARQFIAIMIERHGDWLLPIFERLDEEVKDAERKQAALERVRRIAQGME